MMSRSNLSSASKAQYAQWGILILLMVVLLSVAFGFLLQLLWNIVVVDVFGVAAISFWQAVGLFIIAKLFFGFGVGGSGRGHRGKKRWAKELSRRSPEKHSPADSATSGEPGFEDDVDFQAYWAAEGKAAYEAFRDAASSDQPR